MGSLTVQVCYTGQPQYAGWNWTDSVPSELESATSLTETERQAAVSPVLAPNGVQPTAVILDDQESELHHDSSFGCANETWEHPEADLGCEMCTDGGTADPLDCSTVSAARHAVTQ